MIGRPVVAHVVHSLATGGLENGVVNLVNTAGLLYHHVVVCMGTAGAMRRRLNPAVEVFTLEKREGHDVSAFVRLVKLLRRVKPAIVHTRNWAAFDAIPAAWLAGTRVVVHGEHGREATDPDGRNARRNRARRMLSPLVSHFVAVSGDLRRWLVQDVRLPASKVTTIPNGVDTSRFGYRDRAEARRALGLPAGALVIGTVGRLDPVKDQAGVVRAFAALLPSYPDAWLVLAGDGPCRSELGRLAVDLGVSGRVRLLGECGDVGLVLAAMDLFTLPSIAEGMSNTLLEAMASGLPVVATRVGGNSELVEDGVSGRLISPRDPAVLARALAGYLDDPHLRTLHGKAARDRTVEHFGLDRTCDAYVRLYTRLLTAAGRN